MKNLLIYSLLFIAFKTFASSTLNTDSLKSTDPIIVNIDLTAVVEDKVSVTVNPGRFELDSIIYRLPKVIPGTYTISNFGRFIEGLKAFDYSGKELEVNQIDLNSWSIKNATELDKIKYLVNDTFDQEVVGGLGNEIPFSPAGTNIEEDVFVLNLHGFVGYFDSLKNNEYVLDIKSPATFTRSSAIKHSALKSGPIGRTITTTYKVPRYFEIMDNPMMFGNIDVEEFKVGNITVGLSVYSPNKIHSASSIKETIFEMMQAQKDYLGELNTTARYDIFLFLSTMGEGAPKGFGALEHHKSTVVVYPESLPAQALATSMTDVVSHEFFHIVSPLTLHSEDVHYFDYASPTFSKHLWLYEGVTEYFSDHFQISKGLIDEANFYSAMLNKINTSRSFDDIMSFTEMSENVLESNYSKNYLNVYQKGALIGMCLDILLREESEGNRSLLSLIKELSMKYGINKPFEDDKLIDEIIRITYPSIGDFFNTHVIGNTPIDYDVFFNKVGLTKKESKIETNFVMNDGAVIFKSDTEKQVIRFNGLVKDNSFWNDQGVLPEDIVKEFNGELVDMEKAQQQFMKLYMLQPGAEIEMKLE
ncbi:MAG: peptidase M61, partial [Bacteroidia bacterium]|nr:peptidase M61 [Bacteroidia bacterium]